MTKPSRAYLEHRFFTGLEQINARNTVWFSLLERKKDQIMDLLIDTLDIGFSNEEFCQACETSTARGLKQLVEIKQKSRKEILFPLRKAKILERPSNRKRWLFFHESMEFYKAQAFSNTAFWESPDTIKDYLNKDILIIDGCLLYDILEEHSPISGETLRLEILFIDSLFKPLVHKYIMASKLLLEHILQYNSSNELTLLNLYFCCCELNNSDEAEQYLTRYFKPARPHYYDRHINWYTTGQMLLKNDLLLAAFEAFKKCIPTADNQIGNYSPRDKARQEIEEAYIAQNMKKELSKFQKWFATKYK